MSPPPEDKKDVKGKRKRVERAITVSDDESDVEIKSPSKRVKRDPAGSDSDKSAANSAPATMQVSVLLAQTWKEDKGVDPTGYWISEKLDGVR
jgi:DNA ligase-1